MKPLTGPMNQLNWTHKKGLNISEQPLSILASMLKASLNQIEQVSESSSHLRILPTNWHHKQPLSGTKVNIDRLMLVRWWPGFARFIKKLNRYADALETGADGKTDLVDTYRGWAWLPRIGEMFLTMNLRMKPVRHGARTDISRSGVPTV